MTTSSPALERAVLACPLIDPGTLSLVASMSLEDFAAPRNRTLLGAYKTMYGEGVTGVDLLIVKDWIERNNLDEAIGGVAYLSSLEDDLPDIGGLPRYIRELERHRRRRELVLAAGNVAESPEECYVTTLREALAGLDGTTDTNLSDGTALASFLSSDCAHITKSTGMDQLDGMIGGGFAEGQLIVVAAKTGFGKSALACQWCIHSAIDNHQKVLFFSLEMTAVDMAYRIASQISKVPWNQLRDGNIPEMQLPAVVAAQKSIAMGGLVVDDSSSPTLSAITTTCIEVKRSGLDLVVVDFLQLCSAPKKDNRALEIGSVIRGLKNLAKDLKVPVVAISQFNREAGNTRGRPQLEHLKESSEIEHSADIVIIVHKKDSSDTNVDIIVAKNRHGEVGSISYEWDGPAMTFENKQMGPRF